VLFLLGGKLKQKRKKERNKERKEKESKKEQQIVCIITKLFYMDVSIFLIKLATSLRI
jgi:hypothetical protein